MIARSIVALSVLSLGVACSSSYMPRNQGRLAVSMDSGQYQYHHAGRVYPHGLFGGGLIDAVKSVPAAEEAARTYRRRIATGFIVAIAGAITLIGGSLAVAIEDSGDADTVIPIVFGGTAITLGGALIISTGAPYQWDAINLFNDAVDPGAVGPPGAP